MATTAQIDFLIDGAPAAKTLGELQQKSEQLNKALQDAQLGSEEYKKLNQELVKTNRQVKNLELGFEALDNEALASNIGAVAGAVGDVTSSLILLGGENETVEKMAQNIQTALGVSMAFKGAIEGVSAATKIFNNVLRANPLILIATAIGLVIAGIIALITNFDKVKKVFLDAAIWVHDLVEGFGRWKYAILALLGPIGLLYAAWDFFFGEQIKNLSEEEKARKRQMEIRSKQNQELAKQHKERMKQIEDEKNATIEAADETIKALQLEKDTLEAQGKTSDEVTIKILEAEKEKTIAVLNANKAKLESWIEYYKAQAVLSGQSEEDFIKTMKLRGIPLDEFYDKALKLIKDNEDAVQYSENQITKFKREQHEKRVADAQAAADELKQIEEERLQRELEERQFKLAMLERQQEADRLFNERLKAEQEQRFLDETLRLEAQIDEENRLRDEQEQKELERIERNKQAAKELFDAASSLADALHQKELKRVNEKIARGERLTNQELKRLKRQEQIEKAFALAQVGFDTAKGISSAIAAGAGIPFPGNLAAIASGIAAVLSGVAQATQILGQDSSIPDVNTNTSTGNIGNPQENINTPVVNPILSGSTLLNQEPQKVYVLEQDITGVQKKVSAIESQASYG